MNPTASARSMSRGCCAPGTSSGRHRADAGTLSPATLSNSLPGPPGFVNLCRSGAAGNLPTGFGGLGPGYAATRICLPAASPGVCGGLFTGLRNPDLRPGMWADRFLGGMAGMPAGLVFSGMYAAPAYL